MDQLTQAVMTGERPVAMAGSDAFLAGKVVVRITLARGIGHGYKRTKVTLTQGPTGFDLTRELAEQDRANEQDAKEAYDDYSRAKSNIGTPLPPVTLHLILINPGPKPITVTVTDFESELGNFVVYPDTLTLAPGQSEEVTPMVSQLGVTSEEIPFTVALKVGTAKDKHTVVVKDLLDQNGKPKPSQ
jgi:hypothetical protein